MSIQTMQQLLMQLTHAQDGRVAYLLFVIPEPEGLPGHPHQCRCALVNAFATDPATISTIPLGNTLPIEGPGDFSQLALERLQETVGTDWQVQMFQQRP